MNIQESAYKEGHRCGLLGLSEQINRYDEDDYRHIEWSVGWWDGTNSEGAIKGIDWASIKVSSLMKRREHLAQSNQEITAKMNHH